MSHEDAFLLYGEEFTLYSVLGYLKQHAAPTTRIRTLLSYLDYGLTTEYYLARLLLVVLSRHLEWFASGYLVQVVWGHSPVLLRLQQMVGTVVHHNFPVIAISSQMSLDLNTGATRIVTTYTAAATARYCREKLLGSIPRIIDSVLEFVTLLAFLFILEQYIVVGYLHFGLSSLYLFEILSNTSVDVAYLNDIVQRIHTIPGIHSLLGKQSDLTQVLAPIIFETKLYIQETNRHFPSLAQCVTYLMPNLDMLLTSALGQTLLSVIPGRPSSDLVTRLLSGTLDVLSVAPLEAFDFLPQVAHSANAVAVLQGTPPAFLSLESQHTPTLTDNLFAKLADLGLTQRVLSTAQKMELVQFCREQRLGQCLFETTSEAIEHHRREKKYRLFQDATRTAICKPLVIALEHLEHRLKMKIDLLEKAIENFGAGIFYFGLAITSLLIIRWNIWCGIGVTFGVLCLI